MNPDIAQPLCWLSLGSLGKDLFFTEGTGAPVAVHYSTSPRLRSCSSGHFAAECAVCAQQEGSEGRGEAGSFAGSHCSARGCRKV